MMTETMILLGVLQLIVLAIVSVWGIYQVRVTKRLEQEVYRLNVGLDQSIQLLHRAREAVIKIHSAHVFLLEYRAYQKELDDTCAAKFAEMSAYQAELRGLAFAIRDKDLLDLVNKGYSFNGKPLEERNTIVDEMDIRGRSQHLHTRISQLLDAATKRSNGL